MIVLGNMSHIVSTGGIECFNVFLSLFSLTSKMKMLNMLLLEAPIAEKKVRKNMYPGIISMKCMNAILYYSILYSGFLPFTIIVLEVLHFRFRGLELSTLWPLKLSKRLVFVRLQTSMYIAC